jgi:ribose/xylose/arabinose/galactoside ABC-type transport system permease subunit
VKRALRRFGPLFGLVATWLLFALTAGPGFTSFANQQLMLLQTAVVGTAAVGATWVIVAGGIDLSVGSNIALCSMLGASVLAEGGSSAGALAVAVAGGAALGALLGTLVVGALARAVLFGAALLALVPLARNWGALGAGAGAGLALLAFALGGRLPFRLPLSPFIVTLGLWGALRGLAKGLGDNQPIYPESTGWIAHLMRVPPGGPFALVPPAVAILLGLAALAALFLRSSIFGRHAVAIGSNEETARLCGIAIERTKLGVYVLAGACAGLAGVLQLSYLSMGDPTTAQGYELKCIAAAVIGGASLAGGEGSIGGTLIGALLMTVVDNGCTKLGLDNWVQEVVTGAIIVAAVVVDRLRQRVE